MTDGVEQRQAGWQRSLYRVLASLLFVYFFAVCFSGLAKDWQWGHGGFNGAAFSQAARNSLRHGIVWQAPYYFGVAAPGQPDMYPDHPQMLHWHLMLFQSLFSDAEWANRLTPAIYSLLALLMLFLLARRLSDRWTALLAAGIYALTPLNQIFANMINHEQGGVFWCLTLVYAYCRWHKKGGRRHLIASLVTVTMAVQFDWPGYYLAFFLACHALVTGLRRHPGWWSWRREYTWIAWFSAVVLVNFFGFFLWIYLVRGTLDNVIHSFFWRSSEQSGYLELLWARSWDLRGPVLLGLVFLWPPILIWRLRKKRAGLLDLAAGLFLLTQLVHSAVFQQAGRIHCYWTIYLGPMVALGGAVVLRELGALLGRLPWPVGRLRSGLRLALLAALVGWQLQVVSSRAEWGWRSGTAAYVDHYFDQLPEQAWAHQVGQIFDRTRVRYLLHASIQRPRLEMSYYLDAPSSPTTALKLSAAVGRGVRPVLLVDLNNLQQREKDLPLLAALTRRFGASIWDRRFVAIDSGAPAGPLRAFRARILDRPWWWRWLVHPERPRLAWEPDPAPWAADRALQWTPPAHRSTVVGRKGGGQFAFRCGPSQVLHSLEVQVQAPHDQDLLGALRPSCESLAADHAPEALARLALQPTHGFWYGRLRPGPLTRIACRFGDVAVGLHGHAGRLLDGIGLRCASFEASPEAGGQAIAATFGQAVLIPQAGGQGGAAFDLQCPAGQAIDGLLIFAGALIDGVSISCAVLDAGFFPLAPVAGEPAQGEPPPAPVEPDQSAP